MTHQPRRYHPFSILIDMWNYIKNAFIPALFLFVLNFDSDAFMWKYGRYIFLIITGGSFIYFIFKWFTRKYVLSNHSFHLYQGIFNKEEQTVPFQKVQNISRKTSIVHRLFHITSLHCETAMSGENATVVFKAINEKQASELERLIEGKLIEEDVFSDELKETDKGAFEETDKKIHFTATTHDTIRASFSSFSFLVLIPILFSIYSNIDEWIDIEEQTTGILNALFKTWWMTFVVILIAIMLSMLIGIIRIYLKYGKYEIASDNNQIYIKRGILNESIFVMAKRNVQAINIDQSFIKRLLGIVEIKLVSAGDLSTNDYDLEISSLYPFLKKERAYAILRELLPEYELTDQMNHLPKQALWISLFKGFCFYLIPAIAVFYFKPTFWGTNQTWWIVILILLFVVINTSIILSHKQSGYVMNKSFLQIKKATLSSSLFVSKRNKITESSISRSVLQKRLGLATLKIVNRAQPVKHTTIEHVPLSAAADFYHWYKHRATEISLEHHVPCKENTSQA